MVTAGTHWEAALPSYLTYSFEIFQSKEQLWPISFAVDQN